MLTIKPITEEFAVCQVEDYSQVNLENPFVFTGQQMTKNHLFVRLHLSLKML